MADFVSVVDSDSSGGISVINESTPVGSIVMWGKGDIPDGWLELNGQSTSGYPEIANIYGGYLPDFRGLFVRGLDNGRGLDSEPSRTILSTQEDAIRNITGHFTVDGRWNDISGAFAKASGGGEAFASGAGYLMNKVTFDVSRQVPTANENRVKNISVMYIIKAE